MLATLQAEYAVALTTVDERIRARLEAGPSYHGTPVAITHRIKTPTTLIEKRDGTSLSTMQDVVGLRLVSDLMLVQQDRLARDLRILFSRSKVVDRRKKPSHGYRAIHLVVDGDGIPVEIQIRSHFQHLWADITERLADDWGRGIRYGRPPEGQNQDEIARRTTVVDKWKAVAGKIDRFEQATQSVFNSVRLRVGRQRKSGVTTELGKLAEKIIDDDPKLKRRLERAGKAVTDALKELDEAAR